jgi:monoamine oxidase
VLGRDGATLGVARTVVMALPPPIANRIDFAPGLLPPMRRKLMSKCFIGSIIKVRPT